MIEIVEKMIQNTQRLQEETDYIQDGLWHCYKCNTPKQCRVSMFGKEFTPFCTCKCEWEKVEAEQQQRERCNRQERIHKLRKAGIPQDMHSWTFENDKGYAKALIAKAQRYADAWERLYAENIGVMFWGSVGNGKTYAAACIANRMIDNEVPVIMTAIPRLLNDLSGFRIENKNAYLDSLNRCALLIIDDLGAERGTEYALEKVYEVIDGRYKSGRPLIVTTNLSLDELKNPKSMEHERIYSRVLELCTPIKCVEPSIRPAISREKMIAAKKLFGE